MIDQLLLDDALQEALTSGPRVAPATAVDGAIASALRSRQRRPWFARLDARAWPPARVSIGSPAVRATARLVLIAAIVSLVVTASVVVGARLLERWGPPEPFRTTTLKSAGTLESIMWEPVAIALDDGGVLVAGSGEGGVIASLFDPATGASATVETGLESVGLQGAASLPDGRIFLLGWEYFDGGPAGRPLAWVFDPRTNELSPRVQLPTSRIGGSVTSLSDGRVLVHGGFDHPESPAGLESSEVFDPASATFSKGPIVPLWRDARRAVGLADEKVLIVGGDRDGLDVAVLDADTGDWLGVGTLPESPRRGIGSDGSRLVTLADGSVLVIGRQIAPQTCGRHDLDPIAAFLYNPKSGTLARAPNVPHRVTVAVAIPDGRVVLAGLWQVDCGPGTTYTFDGWIGIYDPDTGGTLETLNPLTGEGSLAIGTNRRYVAGAVLPDGRIALVDEDQTTGAPNAIDILEVAPK